MAGTVNYREMEVGMVKEISSTSKEWAKAKMTESRDLKRYLYIQVHGSIIHNSQLKTERYDQDVLC